MPGHFALFAAPLCAPRDINRLTQEPTGNSPGVFCQLYSHYASPAKRWENQSRKGIFAGSWLFILNFEFLNSELLQ